MSEEDKADWVVQELNISSCVQGGEGFGENSVLQSLWFLGDKVTNSLMQASS